MAPTQISIKVSINLVIFVEGLGIYSPAKLKLGKELQSSFLRCKHSAYFNIDDTYMKNMIPKIIHHALSNVYSNAMAFLIKHHDGTSVDPLLWNRCVEPLLQAQAL